MTEGDAREIAHAFRLGLEGLLADHEIERFLEALPDPADRLERFFRLAEAKRVELIDAVHKVHAARLSLMDPVFNTIDEQTATLRWAVGECFAYVEDVDGMSDRLASARPPDLTLEDGLVMAAWMSAGQRDAYRLPLAQVAANLRRLLTAPSA